MGRGIGARRESRAVLMASVLCAAFAFPADAQQSTDDAAAVLGVAEAALEAISVEDWVALTDLMIDEALILAATENDGRHGYQARTREQERNGPDDVDILERGFDPDVRVAGNVGMVWFPYDLYVNEQWSHCGVDIFTVVRTEAGWRIALLAYSVEQPPACSPHPDGDLR
ncbi:MAG: hypothetical protein GKS06_00725 [Acidobacteria bacterium]|nr:hypothetical protein [Acidobacteriota bacterium]